MKKSPIDDRAFVGRARQSSAAFRDSAISAVTRILTLPEELFVGHHRLVRVILLHVIQVVVVIGQAHHQPGGLPEIRAEFA
jgi:hypothetical protein